MRYILDVEWIDGKIKKFNFNVSSSVEGMLDDLASSIERGYLEVPEESDNRINYIPIRTIRMISLTYVPEKPTNM